MFIPFYIYDLQLKKSRISHKKYVLEHFSQLQVPLVGDHSGHKPVDLAVWQWTLLGLAATCMGPSMSA
jgi:hypothetical protein